MKNIKQEETMTMTTEVTKQQTDLVGTTESELAFIKAADMCSEISQMKSCTLKSLRIAKGMKDLRSAMEQPEIKELILGFQGTPLGFVTDRDKPKWNPQTRKMESQPPYPESKVLDCALEALTAGGRINGNEFNIIADRTYFAQSFFVRKVREYCQEHKINRSIEHDVKDLGQIQGSKQHKWEVTSTIFWRFPTEEKSETHKQVNKYRLVGMTEDQVKGKAEKRAHQWLYNELTDNNFALAPDDTYDIDQDDVIKEQNEKAKEQNPVDFLVNKHGKVHVSGYFKEIELMQVKETLEDLKSNASSIEKIKGCLDEFDKMIGEFSKV